MKSETHQPARASGDLVHEVLADMFRRLKTVSGFEEELALALEQLSREGRLKDSHAVEAVLTRRH